MLYKHFLFFIMHFVLIINFNTIKLIFYCVFFVGNLMGIGDWGLGVGDWGLGPIPNPQSPIHNPQSPIPNFIRNKLKIFNKNINEQNISGNCN